MLLRRYEMPWRAPYEIIAGMGWTAAIVGFIGLTPGTIPANLGGSLSAAALLMAARRTTQAFRIIKLRVSLSGRAMEMITTKQFARLTDEPDQVFFGYGFEWRPEHSQRLYELSKVDYRSLTVSPLLIKLFGYVVTPQPESEIGMPYIHGVEPHEAPLRRPLQNFEGGTLIVGTTQSGKGVALATLITQAVRRQDVVIVIDPKNSKRLRRIVARACQDYRSEDTFLFFHPAFPETGVRLDFTFNWQKPTEIASRIQSIMPADTAGAFTAFGWDAINVVVQALVDLEERPNLVKLTRYIEGGIEPILEETLRRYFARELGQDWRNTPGMMKVLDKANRGNIRSPTAAASADLLAFVEYYEHSVPQSQRNKVIDAQVRTFRHNREHYQKITANLLPVLSMLTSGDLGRTLSPDPFDPDDVRPIMNFEKIERAGHVLYMCLDSMPDPSVASAIAGLALADLAARSGMRYNLGKYCRVSLFVDEVSNCINLPLIELMNKGAEGGVFTTVAMQTLADMAKRLGSEDAARMALGNLNNLIAFRTKDQPTQLFVAETFGKTPIQSVKLGITDAIDGHFGDFTSASSRQVNETLEETIQPAILGKLPNLQFFASMSGGRLSKGRFTLLDPDYDVRKGEQGKETSN